MERPPQQCFTILFWDENIIATFLAMINSDIGLFYQVILFSFVFIILYLIILPFPSSSASAYICFCPLFQAGLQVGQAWILLNLDKLIFKGCEFGGGPKLKLGKYGVDMELGLGN